jgi:hypothetical protein
MYERFTDRARKAMKLANQEAQRFQHRCIGGEHILLGIVKEGSGVAVNVLTHLGVEPQRIVLEVERLVRSGPDNDIEKLPDTPRAKRVIEHSMEEARNLNHNYVGTEHILLALLREDVGRAAVALLNLGLRRDVVRAEILATLERLEAEGGTAFSPESRIGRANSGRGGPVSRPDEESRRRTFRLDDETKRRVYELAEAIAPLQKAKEDAVARGAFERAAQLRDECDTYWKELGGLDLPEWVGQNARRLVAARRGERPRYPILEELDETTGEPDPWVLSLLPNPMSAPAKILVGVVPHFAVSTLKLALAPEEIGSPYFQALVPLISPESLARHKFKPIETTKLAFFEIRRAITSSSLSFSNPVLLCVVRPTALPEDAGKELYAGLQRTNCEFVVFDEASAVVAVMGKLPAGTQHIEA